MNLDRRERLGGANVSPTGFEGRQVAFGGSGTKMLERA